MFTLFTKKSARPPSIKKSFFSGFTLIELLVVIVIMSLITLVFLNRQNKFDSSTIMRSLAYSLALSVRQAQVYGVSVRPTSSTSGNFSSAHGLYFSASNPTSYVLFADLDRDNKYILGNDSIDKNFSLNGGYSISQFCAVGPNGTRCSASTISFLSIIFVRPNPDAQIYAYDAGGNPILFGGYPEVYSSAYIKIASNNNSDSRYIAVTNTGQVTVCAPGAAIGSSGC